jgi:hypothetical protein
MKSLLRLLLPALLLFTTLATAEVPRLRKIAIADTGATAYFPGEPEFKKNLSEDGSEVFTTELEAAGQHYGLILVRLKASLQGDSESREPMLWSYMEFLQQSVFELTDTVPPGYGHRLDSAPQARGILSMGEDAAGEQYWIKGWTDGRLMAVLYLHAPQEPNINLVNLYLDSFRFPAGP